MTLATPARQAARERSRGRTRRGAERAERPAPLAGGAAAAPSPRAVAERRRAGRCARGRAQRRGHLTVTVAPAPSRAALAFSAASLSTFSRTALGAPSTRSLASFRPRLVRARTSLMTWIFLSPAASRMTSNSSCSSTSSASAAPPPPAAGDGDGGGRGDLEGLLELLHELGELDEGHLLERVEQLVGAELRHGGVLSVVVWAAVVGGVGWCGSSSGRRGSVGSGLGDVAGGGLGRGGGSASAPAARRALVGAAASGAGAGASSGASARRASTVRAACDSGAANSAAALVRDAFSAPAILASSTSRDSRSARPVISVGGERPCPRGSRP